MIKAKSMFEEPIKIGLIRFADLYDHRKDRVLKEKHKGGGEKWQLYRYRQAQIESEPENEKEKEKENEERNGTDQATKRQQREQQDFDSSHQPILVIYTSVSGSEK